MPARPTPQEINSTRFRLLAELSLALARSGCSSQLVHRVPGGAVLFVGDHRPARDRLAIAAVERTGHWVFASGGRWADVAQLDRFAVAVAKEVRA